MDSLKAFDQAESIRDDIMKELHTTEARAQTVDVLLERLVALLREVGELGKKLAAANERGNAENAELLAELEKARARLSLLMKQFPSDLLPPGKKSTQDAVANARMVEVGSWNSQQRLANIEKELDEAKKSLDEANKEAEEERARLNALKKLAKDAESLLKKILGPKTAESLNGMVDEVRVLIDNERRGNASAKKKLETCLRAQKEMKAEFEDVRQLLRQLHQKCAEIEQAMNELHMKDVGQAPTFRDDADETELFDQALKWLVEKADQLINEIRKSNARLAEIEQEQKKLDDGSQEAADAFKRMMAAIPDLNNKIQNAESRLRAEAAACDAAMQAAEDRRKLYDGQLDQLKGIRDEEKARSAKMAEMLKPVYEDLNNSLDRLKKECKQAMEKNADLARLIEKVLDELKNLQDRRGNYMQAEEERSKQLDREEEELRNRLRDAEQKLKEGKEKRRAAVDELRDLKKQLNDLAEAEHGMGEQFDPEKDDLLKMQADTIRAQMELERLQEKANASDRTLETREQMLNEMQDRIDDMEKQVKKAEKDNERLKWEIESSGDEGEPCTKCEEGPNLEREEQLIRGHNEALKKDIDDLRRRLNAANDELAEMAPRSKLPPGSAGPESVEMAPRSKLPPGSAGPESVEGPQTRRGPGTRVISSGQGTEETGDTGESEEGGNVNVNMNVTVNLDGKDDD